MKKILLILLTVLILSAFCACSNDNVSETTVKSTSQIQESTMKHAQKNKKSDNVITVQVGDKSFTAQLYDNETAKVFSDMLPLTLNMNELHGNEKYYYLKSPLPSDSSNVGNINNGDIMLYGNDCLVLFYDSFSTEYSYTEIGYIENPSDLAETVGSGDITITFEK